MPLRIDTSRSVEKKIQEEDEQKGSLNDHSVTVFLDDSIGEENELNLAAKRAVVQQQNCLKISSKHRRSYAFVDLTKIKKEYDNGTEYEGWSIKPHKNSKTLDLLLKTTTNTQAEAFLKKIQWFADRRYKIDKLVVSDPNIGNTDLFSVIELFPIIKELKLIGCSKIKDDTMWEIAQIRQNFQTLDLSKCLGLTDKGRNIIIYKNSKELVHLTLKGIRNLRDQELIDLAPSLKNLKTLDLSECPFITDAGVKAIVEHCQNLEVLNLNGCRNVTSKGLEGFGSRNLQVLDLSGCDISDELLLSIAPRSPNLQSLNLHGCKNVADKGAEALAASCTNLQSLNLHWCKNVTDKGVQAIAASCTDLQDLDLSHCSFSKPGLDALIPLKKLSVLNLYNDTANVPAISFSMRRKDVQVNY